MWIMFRNKQKLSTKLKLIIEADWLIFISGIHFETEAMKQWQLTECQQHQTMSTELLVKTGRGICFYSTQTHSLNPVSANMNTEIMRACCTDSARLFPDENCTSCRSAEITAWMCIWWPWSDACFEDDGQVLADPLQLEHFAPVPQVSDAIVVFIVDEGCSFFSGWELRIHVSFLSQSCKIVSNHRLACRLQRTWGLQFRYIMTERNILT